jgi:hypothetical protein
MHGMNSIKFKQISTLEEIMLLCTLYVILCSSLFGQYCLYATLLNMILSSNSGTVSNVNLTFLLFCYFLLFVCVYIICFAFRLCCFLNWPLWLLK